MQIKKSHGSVNLWNHQMSFLLYVRSPYVFSKFLLRRHAADRMYFFFGQTRDDDHDNDFVHTHQPAVG